MSAFSPQQRAALYIKDAIEYAGLAIQFLNDQSDEQLESDIKTQFAIVRAIEVV